MKPIAVNGVTKENRQPILKSLPVDFVIERNGQKLELIEIFLRAEPDNPYDSKAVAVYDRFERKIGYVPQNEEQRDNILNALKEGFVTASAIRVGGTKDKPTVGLRFLWHYWDTVTAYGWSNVDAKDADDEPEVQRFFRDPIQKKHRSQDWKDVVKKNRKGRLTYQEIEAIKAAC